MGNLHGRMPTKGFFDNVQVVNKDGSPLTGFELSDFDTSGNPIYLGQIRADGYWYIASFNTSTGAVRYCQGISDYSTNWTNRATQTYQQFNEVF